MRRQPPADANILCEIAYLHWENVVHGNSEVFVRHIILHSAHPLLQANIMIDEYHHVRLTAFGLSNFAEHDGHVKLD